ncbi:MAG: hypothetical protein GX556_10090 [Fibrobacter sp.]|nr:hypothetical protein [Fibrobacter sp.]
MLSVTRKHALMITIAAVTIIPMGSISIGAVSLYPARIIIIFGTIRVLFRKEYVEGPLNNVDKMVLLWAALMVVTGIAVPRADASIISRFGFVYDAVGIYFLFRVWIKNTCDILAVAKTAAITFCIIALLMLYEKAKGFNLFSHLGGVSPYPTVRDGKIRCNGPFVHSILAGTVPATSLAWFIVLNFQNGIKKIYIYLGICASVSIILLSTSSGPIMSLLLVIIALCAWPLREKMKLVRYGILISLFSLNFLMNSPVWYLIAKIDLTGSSTGWHRSELIDSSIRHLGEWWLAGTDYTRHWMPSGVTWSERHTDITNQYVKNGVNGGLATMLTFIMMIVYGFRIVGKAMAILQQDKIGNKILVWTLGSTLFAHTITFLSVCYFDQSYVYFYLTLAMIGALYTQYSSESINIFY